MSNYPSLDSCDCLASNISGSPRSNYHGENRRVLPVLMKNENRRVLPGSLVCTSRGVVSWSRVYSKVKSAKGPKFILCSERATPCADWWFRELKEEEWTHSYSTYGCYVILCILFFFGFTQLVVVIYCRLYGHAFSVSIVQVQIYVKLRSAFYSDK